MTAEGSCTLPPPVPRAATGMVGIRAPSPGSPNRPPNLIASPAYTRTSIAMQENSESRLSCKSVRFVFTPNALHHIAQGCEALRATLGQRSLFILLYPEGVASH